MQNSLIHAKLDAKLLVMALGDATGKVNFAMDSFPLRLLIGGIAKNSAGIEQLAQLYGAFDAEQGQAVAPLLYGAFLKDPLTVTGVPELMDLTSGNSPSRLAAFRREAPEAIVGSATNFPVPQTAGAVPGMDLGEAFRTEVRSAIPTIVFSGDLDLRTPIEEQAAATARLTRSTRVTVHGADTTCSKHNLPFRG